jgi:hypothetical protein
MRVTFQLSWAGMSAAETATAGARGSTLGALQPAALNDIARKKKVVRREFKRFPEEGYLIFSWSSTL